MNSGMIAENIFSAIDVIVDKKLREAKYDSTIIAKIIKVQDSALGRYEVQYQDAKFVALSVGGGAYQVNDNVYILVPTNDLSRDKYILGLSNNNRRATALGDVVTTAQLQEIIERIEELEDQEIPQLPSLDEYAKKSDVYTKTEIDDGYAKISDLNAQKVQVVAEDIADGIEIASITIGTQTPIVIKAPEAVEAGSIVTYKDTTAANGDTIGTLTIDGQNYDIKAPSLADYAKSSDIPNLNGYATQTWVQNTALQGYAKTGDIPNLNGYATESWVNQQGYITTIPSDDLSVIEGSDSSNGVILQLESGNSTDQITIVGTGAAKVTYNDDDDQIEIYAPQSTSGGGDTVSYTSEIPSSSGTHIGTLKINGVDANVYAPLDQDTKYGFSWDQQTNSLQLVKNGTSSASTIPYATRAGSADSAGDANKLGGEDASIYVTSYILSEALDNYQSKLTAGNGIGINNNTISIDIAGKDSASNLGGVYGNSGQDINFFSRAPVIDGVVYYKNDIYDIANTQTAGLVKPIRVIDTPAFTTIANGEGAYYSVDMDEKGGMFVQVPKNQGSGEGEGSNKDYTLGWNNSDKQLTLSDGSITQSITVGYATTANSAAIADEAKALNLTKAVGSITQPVYFNSSGVPTAINYTIAKNVPSDAQFTDTIYTLGTSDNYITLTNSKGETQSIPVLYATKAGSADTASNSTKLNNKDASYYATASALTGFQSTITQIGGVASAAKTVAEDAEATANTAKQTAEDAKKAANEAKEALTYKADASDLTNYLPLNNLKSVNSVFSIGSNDINTNATSQIYPVALDSNNKLSVHIPWENNKVTTTATTTSKYYLTGQTNTNGGTGSLVFRTNTYVDASGQLYSNGQKVLTSHQQVTNSAPTLEWGKSSTIGTVGNTNLTVTMPANPNTDTGATSVELDGNGNAVTAASYNSETRMLTLTKGATYATQGQINTIAETATQAGQTATSAYNKADGAIGVANNAVGFAEDALAKANTNAGSITGLGDRVSAIEGRESNYLTESDVNNKYATTQDFQGYQQAVGKIGDQAETAKSTAEAAQGAAKTAQATAEAAAATANEAQQTATQFSGRLSAAEGAITGLQNAGYIAATDVEKYYVKNDTNYQALTNSVNSHDQAISTFETTYQRKLTESDSIKITDAGAISATIAGLEGAKVGMVYENYDGGGELEENCTATVTGGYIYYTDTQYNDATTSASGLMSAADKTKLDGLTMSYSNGVLTITYTD